MDILPTSLATLLKTILLENSITSWRIQHNQCLSLSIRFGSHVGSTETPLVNKHFRSKPPSAIQRDMNRQHVYYDSKDASDTGFSENMNMDMSKVQDITGDHGTDNINFSTPYHRACNMRQTSSHSAPSYESLHTPPAVDHGHSLDNMQHNAPTCVEPHGTNNVSTQVEPLVFSDFECQAIPAMKKRKTQTYTAQWSIHTQTLKEKCNGTASQTEVSSVDKQTTTKSRKMSSTAVCTDSLLTTSCHVQTYHNTKQRGTQYKKQNYPELNMQNQIATAVTRAETPPPVDTQQLHKSSDTLTGKQIWKFGEWLSEYNTQLQTKDDNT